MDTMAMTLATRVKKCCIIIQQTVLATAAAEEARALDKAGKKAAAPGMWFPETKTQKKKRAPG